MTSNASATRKTLRTSFQPSRINLRRLPGSRRINQKNGRRWFRASLNAARAARKLATMGCIISRNVNGPSTRPMSICQRSERNSLGVMNLPSTSLAGAARGLTGPREGRARKVPPEVLQRLHAAEQRCKYRRVQQQNVTATASGRRHPQEVVELPISGFRERVRLGHINRLVRENIN